MHRKKSKVERQVVVHMKERKIVQRFAVHRKEHKMEAPLVVGDDN
jgi:hypothetical protein